MEQYPYDASLEWIPREYQGESPTDYERRIRKEEASQSQKNTGYIDYPSVTPAQPMRQAQTGQYGQTARQQSYAGSWTAPAPRPQYATQARQQQMRPASREVASGKMSKADALDLLDSLKKSILVGAVIGFGVLSALVATHAIGSAASSSQSTPGFTTPDGNSNAPDNTNNPSNNGGYFNQQGGVNGFGSGGYSQPSSGTHTS